MFLTMFEKLKIRVNDTTNDVDRPPILEGEVPGQVDLAKGQPREQADNSNLRLLRRVSKEVRQLQGVEMLDRGVRLLADHRLGGQPDPRPPWGS